eukprot:5037138-Pyramimonas_sp.AAC.1
MVLAGAVSQPYRAFSASTAALESLQTAARCPARRAATRDRPGGPGGAARGTGGMGKRSPGRG